MRVETIEALRKMILEVDQLVLREDINEEEKEMLRGAKERVSKLLSHQ